MTHEWPKLIYNNKVQRARSLDNKMVAKETHMILTADLGNTALTLGIYDDVGIRHHFFTATDVQKTENEYQITISQWLQTTSVVQNDFQEVILCSVVPPLTTIIKRVLENLTLAKVLVIGKKVKTGLAIHVDHPSEVGADLVAASVAGIQKYGYPLVIADLGTASKIIAIDASGAFVGVAIAPGLMVSLQALVGRASQLSDVELEIPPSTIGRNTKDSINSGTLIGHAEMIRGLAKRVMEEIHCGKPLVLTGGYARYVLPLLDNVVYDQHLLLDGLCAISKKNRGM